MPFLVASLIPGMNECIWRTNRFPSGMGELPHFCYEISIGKAAYPSGTGGPGSSAHRNAFTSLKIRRKN